MILELYKIKNNTPIFRYLSIGQFLSFLEKRKTYLTKITAWDDPYEDITRNLQVINSAYRSHEFRTFKDYYAQSWSLVGDSDAMWRIYSTNKLGIRLQTRVEKLRQIIGIEKGLCGKVIYFKSMREGLLKLNKEPSNENLNNLRLALLKRPAFTHEKEVRLISNKKYFSQHDSNYDFLEFDLNPTQFIENILIDPRSPDWYVETVQEYCKRYGLTIKVQKSQLYKFDDSMLDNLRVNFK